MEALKLLFGSDIGLLSVFTIGFIVVMAIWFANFYSKKIDEESGKQG